MTHGDDPYENLANGIIIQAVKDWRRAAKILKRNPNNKAALSEIEETERFFRSEWYETLTDVDGEYLIERLRKEAGI